jgi:DNA invertase Pin-like site-specific DNA recombinase
MDTSFIKPAPHSGLQPTSGVDTAILAFYGRFSTDLQRDTSIDDQLAQSRRAGQRIDATIPDHLVMSDEAMSGTSSDNRPGLQRLIRMAKQKPAPFEGIAIADTSRLARNLEELLRIYKILKFHGIYLYVADKGLDSRSPFFEIALTFAGMMDEQFVAGVKDKSRRGAIGSIDRGYNPGGKCYGYRNVAETDPTRKGIHGGPFVIGVRQEVIQEEASVVRRIFEMYAHGYSYERIAKQLNQEGVTTRQPVRTRCVRSWSHTGIRDMLFNERYRGRVIYGRTTTEKDPETLKVVVRKVLPSEWIVKENENLRIVSEELWEAVRSQNQRKNQKTSSAKEGGMNRTAASRTYIFSGCLECGICKASIVVVGRKGDEPVYGCPYQRFRGVCKNDLRITKDRLEQQLLGRIVASLRAPEYVELIATEFDRQLEAAQKAAQCAAEELTGKVDELRRERAGLVKRSGNLADAIALHGLSNALSSQLSEAEKRIEVIDRWLKPQPKSDPVAFAPEKVREFLARKMAQLVQVLAGDPELAKQEIASRIDKLILTPDVRDGLRVFAVTGDVRLFGVDDDDVMPCNSQEGIVGHYMPATICLDGFVLDPKLLKAA